MVVCLWTKALMEVACSLLEVIHYFVSMSHLQYFISYQTCFLYAQGSSLMQTIYFFWQLLSVSAVCFVHLMLTTGPIIVYSLVLCCSFGVCMSLYCSKGLWYKVVGNISVFFSSAQKMFFLCKLFLITCLFMLDSFRAKSAVRDCVPYDRCWWEWHSGPIRIPRGRVHVMHVYVCVCVIVCQRFFV